MGDKRYEVKVGKFGMFFHDGKEGEDMPLEAVCERLNRMEALYEQIEDRDRQLADLTVRLTEPQRQDLELANLVDELKRTQDEMIKTVQAQRERERAADGRVLQLRSHLATERNRIGMLWAGYLELASVMGIAFGTQEDLSLIDEIRYHVRALISMAAAAKRAQNANRVCRVCGCTDTDCRECLQRTGVSCYWIEEDLCSACGIRQTPEKEGGDVPKS